MADPQAVAEQLAQAILAAICTLTGTGCIPTPKPSPSPIVSASLSPASPTPIPTPSLTPAPTGTPTATPTVTPVVTPTPREIASPSPSSSATLAPVTFTGIAGIQGTNIVARHCGDTLEPSEQILVTYSGPTNFWQFGWWTSPTTQVSEYALTTSSFVVTVRKTPGVTTQLGFLPFTAPNGASVLAAQCSFVGAAPTIPPPTRVITKTQEPYRYGTLDHPASPTVANLAQLLDSGIGYVRAEVYGSQADWSIWDARAKQFLAANITLMPVATQYNAPSSKADTQGRWTNASDFAAYAGAIAAHVVAFPQITRMEIFNEPNTTSPPWNLPSDAVTTQFMKAAYAAIKVANPNLTVVGPAMATGGPGYIPAQTMLSDLYANGCKVGVCWDVLSVHPYEWQNPTFGVPSNNESRWNIYQALQDIAVAHGDPKPHVMLTEWGYSTMNDPNGFDPLVQADYMAIGFNLMLADPTVDGITWANVATPCDEFYRCMTVYAADGARMPGANVLRSFTGATP